MTFRKPKTERIYQKFLKTFDQNHCIFCKQELPVAKFKLWVLQKNRFPYDRFAKEHLMLAPIRHIPDREDLSVAEREELEELLRRLNYDLIIENKMHRRSIFTHYHIHLITLK